TNSKSNTKSSIRQIKYKHEKSDKINTIKASRKNTKTKKKVLVGNHKKKTLNTTRNITNKKNKTTLFK
ncbi:hypothetical protein ACJBSR_11270, partial [Streptococcus suis]